MNAAKKPPRFGLRFGLKGLMLTTLAVAVGIVAFRDANWGWVNASTTAALGMALFAAIAARFGGKHSRVFWTGFAICALPFGLFTIEFSGPSVAAYLVTAKAANAITDFTHPTVFPATADQSGPGAEIREGDDPQHGRVFITD